MIYAKTTWKDGDKVTAEKLNNIESGIKSLDSLVDNLKIIVNQLVLSNKTCTVKTFTCSNEAPYFKEVSTTGELIREVNTPLNVGYTLEELYEYFRQTVFDMGAYGGSNDALIEDFSDGRPHAAIGMFIPYKYSIPWDENDEKNWLPEGVKAFFNEENGPGFIGLDSFKIEMLGGYKTAAECTMLVTAYTKGAETYTYQVACRHDANPQYYTTGWHKLF